MSKDISKKSSVEDIRRRFDADVGRFSNFETGQTSTIDAPLVMDLISRAALSCAGDISRIIDIGCGAGNNTIKILESAKGRVECALLDLSPNMLDTAVSRVSEKTSGIVQRICGDFRTATLKNEYYDVAIAAAVFHHLRDDNDWETAFAKVYSILRKGGCLIVSDLVAHDNINVENLAREDYAAYLSGIGGNSYKDNVFECIQAEDSPRSLGYQISLLKKFGFTSVDILHKHSCFGAYIAVK